MLEFDRSSKTRTSFRKLVRFDPVISLFLTSPSSSFLLFFCFCRFFDEQFILSFLLHLFRLALLLSLFVLILSFPLILVYSFLSCSAVFFPTGPFWFHFLDKPNLGQLQCKNHLLFSFSLALTILFLLFFPFMPALNNYSSNSVLIRGLQSKGILLLPMISNDFDENKTHALLSGLSLCLPCSLCLSLGHLFRLLPLSTCLLLFSFCPAGSCAAFLLSFGIIVASILMLLLSFPLGISSLC